MSHILEEYSKSLGVKISKPYMVEHFFPIEFDKYITVHNASKFESRKYDNFDEAIRYLRPYLEKNGIKIVQVGEKNDPDIGGCDLSLKGQTTMNQLAYVIKRSLCHIGIDSFPVHLASMYDIPIVSFYCNMYKEQSKPYWSSENKVILLESHRNGLRPSYSSHEWPKTINMINPEDVAKSALSLLGIDHNIVFNTCFFGDKYYFTSFDYVPDVFLPQNFLANGNVNVRMDLHFDLNCLANCLQYRKANIRTDKEIDINLLKHFKSNILALSIELNDSITEDYLNSCRSLGIRLFLGTKNKDSLEHYRFKFFDFEVDFLEKKSKKDVDSLLKDYKMLSYRSNRFILSKGQIYLSTYDWKNGIAVESFSNNVSKIKDDDLFWEDLDYYYIFGA